MAKVENGGLLSKVVRFVRNPATNWSDLDQVEAELDSGNSKQMLKELVERKKRNDFVRKREFDMLRKLRRRELVGSQSSPPRPSFFQSSLPSKPDERAQTIKKIDEIEAQMSMQWWATKHREPTPNSSVFPAAQAGQAAAAGQVTPPPMLKPMPGAGVADPLKDAPAVKSAPLVGNPVAPAPAPGFVAEVADQAQRGGTPKFETTESGFSSSKYSAVTLGNLAQDPALEEAAIRFANGDDQGAEAGLLDSLGSSGEPKDKIETWLTLFDLYRATGQQARFEIAAIDFANQFQRSAPQWFSMPDMVNQAEEARPLPFASQSAHWSCPPVFGLKSVGVLGDVVARTAPPWRLDWTRLSVIEPEALPRLTQLLGAWADRPVELRLTAADHLDKLLAAGAPSGDSSVPTDWWHARMALLRVRNNMDEFEMTALNYCVTYEVSPPSWAQPLCTCSALSSGAQNPQAAVPSPTGQRAAGPNGPDSLDFHASDIDSMMLPPASVDLSGSIIGDVSEAIERMEARFAGSDILSISCAKLLRVDFAAAGTLLNWVSALQVQGRHVQFNGVHRLIAGFFSVIGISEMARITVRTD